MRRGFSNGLRYTIDLSKIADRENPRTVEAPSMQYAQQGFTIDWGDGSTENFDTAGVEYPSHTYAAEGVYTVVIRNATGHLPMIRFRNFAQTDTTPLALTRAVVSIDHFAGESREYNQNSGTRTFADCVNLKYIDPRLVCKPDRLSFYSILQNCSAVEQELKSLCFDFNYTANASYTCNLTFSGSSFSGDIPAGFMDGVKNAKTFYAVFQNCTQLTGEPFVFWKADGSLDNDKFPDLYNARDAYTGCSAALRAQVPTAYGGTMTVS